MKIGKFEASIANHWRGFKYSKVFAIARIAIDLKNKTAWVMIFNFGIVAKWWVKQIIDDS